MLVLWIFEFNVRRLLSKTFANLTKIQVFGKVFSRQFIPLEYLVNLFHPNTAIVYEYVEIICTQHNNCTLNTSVIR